jgi:electron transfer flavoprotein alpha subunit
MFSRHLRRASTLVVAEHSNSKLSSATLNTISAAVKLQQPITVLLASSKKEDAVVAELQQLPITAVIQSIHSNYEHGIAETLIPLYSKLQQLHSYSHWLFSSTSQGRNLIGRLAGTLEASVISDILEVVSLDTFKRGIYAGNALSTLQSNEKVKLITVRTTAFPPAEAKSGNAKAVKVSQMDPEVPSKSKRRC